MFKYHLLHQSGKARTGYMETRHGVVETPIFMPVGTAATVKGVKVDSLLEMPAPIILGNTYHLYGRPGLEVIDMFGGLHKFMNWPQAILTDSGGFQVMSLARLNKVSDKGVSFRNHFDGNLMELTPENVVEIQMRLNADIQMQLDQCISLPASYQMQLIAMNRSLLWAERARKIFNGKQGHAQFAIVQGGNNLELRRESATKLTEMNFEGYAIGGLAVGESNVDRIKIIEEVNQILPQSKPRYLMGVGTPVEIIKAVALGIDMFDCVMPTRAGRHAMLYSENGTINIKNQKYKKYSKPLDETSEYSVLRDYSLAYLHHLVKTKEILAQVLISEINLIFYLELMKNIRNAIKNNTFLDFSHSFIKNYESSTF